MALVCSPPTGESPNRIASIKFNHDATCFAVATEAGFRVWNASPFRLRYMDSRVGVLLASMLMRTNLILIVKSTEPCSVYLWNDYTKRDEAHFGFQSPVRGIEFVREGIAVALDNRCYVYDFGDIHEPRCSIDTISNPRGLVLYGKAEVANVLVTLTTVPGMVEIRRPGTPVKPIRFRVHTSGVASMALNRDATLLATASERGTVVRVWSTASGEKKAEVRRGMEPASTNGIAFSPDSRWLCVSSDHGTAHIFDLHADASKAVPNTWFRYVGASGLLGSNVSQYSTSHFSTAQVHGLHPASLCVFDAVEGVLNVVGGDGVFARYAYDMAQGGEARSIERFAFVGPEDSAIDSVNEAREGMTRGRPKDDPRAEKEK